MQTAVSRTSIDALIVFFAFFLSNVRASIFIHLFPDVSVWLGPAWIEISLWCLVLLVTVYQLLRHNQLGDYLSLYRKNWFVALFLVLALLSIVWSVDSVTSVFRGLELLLSTLVAAYISISQGLRRLLELLFWFGAIVLILSVALVFAAPGAGTMYWAPFDGAWRGLFWHRNHLSSLTVLFSIVLLFRVLLSLKEREIKGFLDVMLYLLSLVVLRFAESATGYILFILLNFLVLCSWLWLRLYPRLRTLHYVSILGLCAAGLIWVFSHLDTVFGLFNRNTTLTGRIGLWEFLVREMVLERPGWGYGFGAFWTQDSFREPVRLNVGWASQPLIADNGFLDVLLHLGLAGFGVLLLIVLAASLRSARYALAHRTLIAFFPAVVMVYAIVANIPFSLFAETETFIWSLLIICLFITTPLDSVREKSIGQVAARQTG